MDTAKKVQLIKRMDMNTTRWNENMKYLARCDKEEEGKVIEELYAINEEKNQILKESEGVDNG